MIAGFARAQPSSWPSATPHSVLRRQGPQVTLGQRVDLELAWRHTADLKPEAKRGQQQRRTRSERERGADCHGGRSLQKQQQRCTIWLSCCASCLHHPALASPLTARAIEEGTSDARPPADNAATENYEGDMSGETQPANEPSSTAWNRPPHAG